MPQINKKLYCFQKKIKPGKGKMGRVFFCKKSSSLWATVLGTAAPWRRVNLPAAAPPGPPSGRKWIWRPLRRTLLSLPSLPLSPAALQTLAALQADVRRRQRRRIAGDRGHPEAPRRRPRLPHFLLSLLVTGIGAGKQQTAAPSRTSPRWPPPTGHHCLAVRPPRAPPATGTCFW